MKGYGDLDDWLEQVGDLQGECANAGPSECYVVLRGEGHDRRGPVCASRVNKKKSTIAFEAQSYGLPSFTPPAMSDFVAGVGVARLRFPS